MESEKIVNALDATDVESSKFATRKWYVINDQNNTEYDKGNENDSNIKFEKKVIKSSLCDHSDPYFLVTGDITATGGNAITKVAYKQLFQSELARFGSKILHTTENHSYLSQNL